MTRLRKGVSISNPPYNRRDTKNVLIVAGEASADLHGANLVRAIKRLHPHTRFCGIGGDQMAAAGVEITTHAGDMAVVGVTEVFPRLRTFLGAAKRLKRMIKHHAPDLLILIDYPEFNIHIAGVARRCGVPVLYYISPQVWAWRRGRVKKIARRIDRMAVILPFEKRFYEEKGVEVDYVGHPLMDALPAQDRDDPSEIPRFEEAPFVIGLLPGSRREEIRRMLPVMLESVEIIRSAYPDVACLLPLADTIDRGFVEDFISHSRIKVHVIAHHVHDVLKRCRVALVTSGTATLDAAAMEVPMVIGYRVSPFSYHLGRLLIKVPYIGLVNLIAGERVVPEVIQDELTPNRLAQEALRLLADGQIRTRTLEKLKAVKRALGDAGASERTARIALGMMSHQTIPKGL